MQMQLIDIKDKIKKNGSQGEKIETSAVFLSQPDESNDKNITSNLEGGSQPQNTDFDIELIEYPLPVWFGTGLRIVK
jgi:hypothetical protein